jgi:predicted Ser/Thr protein kinase
MSFPIYRPALVFESVGKTVEEAREKVALKLASLSETERQTLKERVLQQPELKTQRIFAESIELAKSKCSVSIPTGSTIVEVRTIADCDKQKIESQAPDQEAARKAAQANLPAGYSISKVITVRPPRFRIGEIDKSNGIYWIFMERRAEIEVLYRSPARIVFTYLQDPQTERKRDRSKNMLGEMQPQKPDTFKPPDAVPPAIPPTAASVHQPSQIKVLGGCRLEEVIGRGGFGIVYRAHHIGLDIPVALKILSAPVGAPEVETVKRFIREARIAARIRHANVVAVLNVGHEQNLRYIVMELVDGISLQALLNKEKRLEVHRAVDIMIQLCEGLQCAHEIGIIHRDLKPDNVLIARDGTVKIADLGLAKRLDGSSGMTLSGMVMGTPYYMAPEQATGGKNTDERSDIYSLGCTLYRMLAGRAPYQAEQFVQVIYLHAHAPIPDVRELNPTVPARLSALIQRMLAKDPDHRYQTVKEVLGLLSSIRK